jgi:hypothetical protein
MILISENIIIFFAGILLINNKDGGILMACENWA